MLLTCRFQLIRSREDRGNSSLNAIFLLVLLIEIWPRAYPKIWPQKHDSKNSFMMKFQNRRFCNALVRNDVIQNKTLEAFKGLTGWNVLKVVKALCTISLAPEEYDLEKKIYDITKMINNYVNYSIVFALTIFSEFDFEFNSRLRMKISIILTIWCLIVRS